MNKRTNITSCIVFCMLAALLCSCGNKNKSDDYAQIYESTIGGLEDDELFAIVEINVSSPVLLVTSQAYEDGLGNQASIFCDVYYPIDGEAKNAGMIESLGTAYPLSYDKNGIYAASGHDLQRFEIDEKTGAALLAERVYEKFDANGNAVYTLEKEGNTEAITEMEYFKAFEAYSQATVVNFSYGASGM